jgi:glutathione reductase (NADPH)
MGESVDLLIIGAGVAGRAVAKVARRAGWSVAMAEADGLGGTCPLRGCEPKKVLWQAAETIWRAAGARRNGLIDTQPRIDWPALMRFKRGFTEPVDASVEQSLHDLGVDVVRGRAEFLAEDRLAVGDREFQAAHIFIGAGATPMRLPFEGAQLVTTSDGFLELDELPASIVFIGGGYISFEFAHIATRCGVPCKIIQRGERALKLFDRDMADLVIAATRDLGVEVVIGEEVTDVQREDDRLRVHVGPERRRLCDCAMVVHGAGRAPNLDGLNLDRAGVEQAKRGVKVDAHFRSVSNPRVWSAGDCADTPFQLTPVADMEAWTAAQNMVHGKTLTVDYSAVPSVTFTLPPLASVGLTEEQARQKGLDMDVRSGDMSGWSSSRRVGLDRAGYKLLVDKATDLILGAHLFGHKAEEMINAVALAMGHGLTAGQLKTAPLAYPTAIYELRYML